VTVGDVLAPQSASPRPLQRLEDLGDLLDVGLLTVDRDLVVRSWNRWMETATRRPADDAVGRPIRELFPELTLAAENALRGATEGVAAVLSHRLHRCFFHAPAAVASDTLATMQQSTRIVPLAGDSGAADGALVIIEDVTDRVHREEELRDAVNTAEAANKAKADFLAAMSHELRTPLGAISGYADLLRDEMFGPVVPAQREPLERITIVSKHLLGIVEEILVYARVEAGRELVHLKETDSATLLRDAVLGIRPLALKKNLQLDLALPDATIPMTTDVRKVGQALYNLLGNAIKFTESGGVTASVRAAETEEGAPAVEFVVTDTGCGIPPEHLDRVFEPFEQGETGHARKHEGTGLGLAVSRQLARLLGGEITASSVVGKGSTFTLILPQRSTVAPAEGHSPG
jgi:signal transduction histidine kinase